MSLCPQVHPNVDVWAPGSSSFWGLFYWLNLDVLGRVLSTHVWSSIDPKWARGSSWRAKNSPILLLSKAQGFWNQRGKRANKREDFRSRVVPCRLPREEGGAGLEVVDREPQRQDLTCSPRVSPNFPEPVPKVISQLLLCFKPGHLR